MRNEVGWVDDDVLQRKMALDDRNLDCYEGQPVLFLGKYFLCQIDGDNLWEAEDLEVAKQIVKRWNAFPCLIDAFQEALDNTGNSSIYEPIYRVLKELGEREER